MRKTQKIIFIIVLLVACFSAYSLAQMNQIKKINFSWNNRGNFLSVPRTSFADWTSLKYPSYMDFDIITNPDKIITINGGSSVKYIQMPKINFDNEFLIFATLGEVTGNGYFIKIKEISQRGNIVEIMVDIAQPKAYNLVPFEQKMPYDFVRVSKDTLDIKGNLTFIFKDYKGNELFKKGYSIEQKTVSVDKI